jgi:aryl-alcohol dehydrogenase-like predicted oxidoreductase
MWYPSKLFYTLHQVRAESQALTDGEVDNSPEHIDEYIEGTIKRLGSTPDLYYLHRIDPKQDLKESITALDKLKKEGKTRYIGLSECNAQTLRKACSCEFTILESSSSGQDPLTR